MKNLNLTTCLMSIPACLALAVVMETTAHGAIQFTSLGGNSYGASGTGGVLPDGTGAGNGYELNFNFSGVTISAVTMTFSTSGSPGYNGDLYAYLSHGSTLVTLLNRVGSGSGSDPQFTYGFSTSGFNNVTLDSSSGNGSIHSIQNPGTGISYTPDGGNLASFNGTDPNGSWTLFFQDMSNGSINTLGNFSVDIEAVPEPVNVALGIVGGLFGLGMLVRRIRNRRGGPWHEAGPSEEQGGLKFSLGTGGLTGSLGARRCGQCES